MITVLVIGSNLLFGVNRWKCAGPLVSILKYTAQSKKYPFDTSLPFNQHHTHFWIRVPPGCFKCWNWVLPLTTPNIHSWYFSRSALTLILLINNQFENKIFTSSKKTNFRDHSQNTYAWLMEKGGYFFTILKEPSPFFTTLIKLFEDSGVTRKLIFFSKPIANSTFEKCSLGRY